MKKIYKTLMILSSATIISSCATIIGGSSSTAEASGDGMGPATISDTSVNLQNDKFTALTIKGNLSATKLVIANDLFVESNATLTKVTVKDDTTINGALNATSCTFKDSVKINENSVVTNSYFGGSIEFGGTSLELLKGSKVIGGIISNNKNPVTIVVDHSQIRGDIGFANSNSIVIIKNGGKITGNLINGTLQKQ